MSALMKVTALLVVAALSAEAVVTQYQLNGQNSVSVETGPQRCSDGTTRDVTKSLTAVLYDKSNTRTSFGSSFDRRMDELEQQPGDHKGHILASVLGGPAQTWNLAPQADNVNKKYRARTSVLNTWYDCEKWVQQQLETKTNFPITLRVSLTYSSQGCRPTQWGISASNNGNSGGCRAANIPNGVDPHFGVSQRPRTK